LESLFGSVVEVDIPPTGAPWLGADVCPRPLFRPSVEDTSVFISLDSACAMPLLDKGAADESHRLVGLPEGSRRFGQEREERKGGARWLFIEEAE
jgi:hypothetical protein